MDRLPEGKNEILLTRHAINASLQSKNIILKEGEQIFAVALDRKVTSQLKGEVARLGTFAFVVFKENSPEIVHFGENLDLKLIRLGLKEINIQLPIIPLSPFTSSLFNPIEMDRLYQHVQASYDQAYLKEHLSIISGETPFIQNGVAVKIPERGSSAGRKMAREYIMSKFQAYGFKTWLEPYGTNGDANVVAEKPGTESGKFVIFSAHLDSVTNAGADDDGSGLVSLLANAKAFSELQHRHTIRMVAFDQEEVGLVGSGEYVRNLALKGEAINTLGAVHLDMTGYDSNDDGAFHLFDCAEGTSPDLTQFMTKAIETMKIPLRNIPACRRRSDHIRFWQYKIPAVMAIEIREQDPDVNPCYHRACDKVDTINFKFLENIAQLSFLSLAKLSEVNLK